MIKMFKKDKNLQQNNTICLNSINKSREIARNWSRSMVKYKQNKE